MAIGADVHLVVIDRVFVAGHTPLQAGSLQARRNRKAVIDSGLDLRSFLVIVPCNQLDRVQLIARVVITVRLIESLQPGLAALLAHDAVLSPRRQGIVEAFIARANGIVLGRGQATLVKLVQVGHAEVGDIHDHPGVAASTHRVGEAARVLKYEVRVGAGCRRHGIPVDRVV